MKWKDLVPPIFMKSSAVTRAVALMWGGNPIWTPKNFESLAKEGYEGNVTTFRCIKEIATAASGISWLLYRKGKSRVIEIEEHPLLTLLERPNPWQGQAAFIEAVTAFLMLSGNSYIERVGPTRGAPKELYALRPDRVKVIPDPKNMIGGYVYEVNGMQQKFVQNEVLQLKLFAALNDWYGFSPISVASKDIDSDNESKTWNYSLLSNYAAPAGALSTEQKLDEKQIDRLRKQVEEKASGKSNAGRPIVLEAGLSWQQISINPKDMDWLEGRKMSRIEICNAFRVPPELIGIQDTKTYSNYQEARKSFYVETILPYMDRLRDELNNWLTPLFGDNIWLEYDKDDIEALQEERDKTWGRVEKASWLTVNEKRLETGYDEVEGGDVILVPASMIPLSAADNVDDGDNVNDDAQGVGAEA